MIQTQNLSKHFGKLCALNNVSVALQKGKGVSLIGPNGSGKTTFIKCLLGMVIPDAGRICFNDQPILPDSWDYRKQIGYMPQIGRYPDNMRVRQVFDLMTDLRKDSHCGPLDEELIEEFGLKNSFDKPMRTLSGGTRQKVSACLAFLFDPAVLVLDEPTAGLDPLAAEALKAKVLCEQQKGKLVLMTSHILNDLEELTTDVMYLVEGDLLFFESVENILERTEETRFAKAIAKIMAQQGKIPPTPQRKTIAL
ncbi:MAG TPA: ABC transporter ATP-binding protein [Haliscomenobacter sp.]|uniref:ABC transporter ATP-binding protein n=1 Tax=Haliscomenobacter sp. TaxID=2717303 RepID=UPI002BF53D2F|nr:ABC transporter ATP-binding protein [Haliscomenobacter sp.]HOY21351.1 ABC transporter ATP-binding protein [Haliscomenobacter sp.]